MATVVTWLPCSSCTASRRPTSKTQLWAGARFCALVCSSDQHRRHMLSMHAHLARVQRLAACSSCCLSLVFSAPWAQRMRVAVRCPDLDFLMLPVRISRACAYRYRLCVEETYALGVLGETGRGACEAAGLQPGQVEVVVASMGTTLASVGGFCVGHHEVRGQGRRTCVLGLPDWFCTAT